jgi:hypothetical protein
VIVNESPVPLISQLEDTLACAEVVARSISTLHMPHGELRFAKHQRSALIDVIKLARFVIANGVTTML